MNGRLFMQYLKDDVRERIITSAQAEFKARGYQGASIKTIAAGSGVTPGNIYHYFSDKEDLFNSAVSPANKLLLDLLNTDAYRNDAAGRRYLDIETVIDRIMSIYEAHSAELMILFFGGEGSKNQNVKADFIRMIERRLEETILVGRADLAFIIASSFAEGFLVALKQHEEDLPKLRELFSTMISLFFKDAGAV